MWEKSKLFLLVLVLGSLRFSVSLSADVTLTDQEFEELVDLQIQQEKTLTAQEIKIMNLENELNQALTLQETLQTTIETLSQLIDALKKSLEMLKTDHPLSLNLGGTWNHEDGPGGYAGLSIEF